MTGKLEWFGGNEHGLQIYNLLEELSHTWDDLVDRDKYVSPEAVNRAFQIALVELPANPVYARLLGQLLPLWVVVIDAYKTANTLEGMSTLKALEISHILRYSAGMIIGYVVRFCVGPEQALKVMPEVWQQIVAEDFEAYAKEHGNA